MLKFAEEGMKKTLEILNNAKERGLIENYAIAGGIAAMYYTETVSTFDLDIFVAVKPELVKGKILSPSSIYECFTNKGYGWKGEHIIVEGVPVQFIFVDTELEKDSLKDAESIPFKGVETKILRAEYLVAIYSKLKRGKDLDKIRYLNEYNIDKNFLNKILKKHNICNLLIKKCRKHLR